MNCFCFYGKYIDVAGDGIDVNGSIYMTEGIVIINRPISNMAGATDYDRTFNIGGGFFVAADGTGAPQAHGTSSTYYSVMLIPKKTANPMICIESNNVEEILRLIPIKAYQAVV